MAILLQFSRFALINWGQTRMSASGLCVTETVLDC